MNVLEIIAKLIPALTEAGKLAQKCIEGNVTWQDVVNSSLAVVKVVPSFLPPEAAATATGIIQTCEYGLTQITHPSKILVGKADGKPAVITF